MSFYKDKTTMSRFFQITRISCWGCLALLLATMGAARSAEPEVLSFVSGTIVSLRGNILVVRPELRPVPVRIAFDDGTSIVFYERTTRASLQVGKRVSLSGTYTAKDGMEPRWMEIAEGVIPEPAKASDGLEIAPKGDFASLRGVVKSLQPLILTDDKGKDFSFDAPNLRSFWSAKSGDRNTLLIGTRIQASGKTSPDGVMQAKFILPERGQSPFGTMFGTVLSVRGNRIVIRPRFTQDKLPVALTIRCRLQSERRLDAATIKSLQHVTFWGEMRPLRGDPTKINPLTLTDFKALALLVGEGRYPSSQGDNAPQYVSGQIVAMNPVRLKVRDDQVLTVFPTAQMIVAQLFTATRRDLKPGTNALFVLSRRPDGSFETSDIVLNASPWVGYGG